MNRNAKNNMIDYSERLASKEEGLKRAKLISDNEIDNDEDKYKFELDLIYHHPKQDEL